MRPRAKDVGELGVVLQVLRVVRGWNQAELAKAAGTRQSAVSDYERGKKLPELRSLQALLNAMGYEFSTVDETLAFIRRVTLPVPADPAEAEQLAVELGRAVARFARVLLASPRE